LIIQDHGMNGILFWNCHFSWSPRTFFFNGQMSCFKPSNRLLDLTLEARVSSNIIILFFFLVESRIRKQYLITAQHSFAAKSPILRHIHFRSVSNSK
jgi:hypothetical protein